MNSLVFFLAFLPLLYRGSITFLKEISINTNVKLLDGGNSTIVLIDEDDTFHLYNIAGEDLEHEFSESIGFNVAKFRHVYKQDS